MQQETFCFKFFLELSRILIIFVTEKSIKDVIKIILIYWLGLRHNNLTPRSKSLLIQK
jgi:hypothetical protein